LRGKEGQREHGITLERGEKELEENLSDVGENSED
jgi:hypothetical protein